VAETYQLSDLRNRPNDPYAGTKYTIVCDLLEREGKLRVIDAGCGSGELSILLAQAGHTVVGFDEQADHIELANERAAEAGVTCDFSVKQIDEFEGDQFDCAVTMDVLEHIEDDAAALAKLVTLVRPGGTIVIAVPAGPWLYGHHDMLLGHFRRYDRPMLRELVRPAGTIEHLRYFGFSVIPVAFAYSRMLDRPYPIESGDVKQSPVRARLLKAVLGLDKHIPMPFGTSLLVKIRVPG
jgi:SAM-dependent methyltransferase